MIVRALKHNYSGIETKKKRRITCNLFNPVVDSSVSLRVLCSKSEGIRQGRKSIEWAFTSFWKWMVRFYIYFQMERRVAIILYSSLIVSWFPDREEYDKEKRRIDKEKEKYEEKRRDDRDGERKKEKRRDDRDYERRKEDDSVGGRYWKLAVLLENGYNFINTKNILFWRRHVQMCKNFDSNPFLFRKCGCVSTAECEWSRKTTKRYLFIILIVQMISNVFLP